MLSPVFVLFFFFFLFFFSFLSVVFERFLVAGRLRVLPVELIEAPRPREFGELEIINGTKTGWREGWLLGDVPKLKLDIPSGCNV